MSALGTIAAPRNSRIVRGPRDSRVLGRPGVGVPPFPVPTLIKSVNFTGTGTLSVAISIEVTLTAGFTAEGFFSRPSTPLYPGGTPGSGLPWAVAVSPNYTGAGTASATVAVTVAANFTGEGTASGVVAVPRTAAFAGVGSLATSATGVASTAANFNGAGTASATVVGGEISVSANFTGAGTLAAGSSTVASVTAAFTGSGTLTASAFSSSSAVAFTGSGTLAATAYSAPGAAFGGTGTLSVPSLGDAMGMDKSGTQVIPSTNVMTKITGWTARSGFPASVITTNGLVMNGAIAGAVVKYKARLDANFGTRRHQLYLNGNPVGSDVASNTEGSATLDLVSGDRLELYAKTNHSSGDTVQAGSTNTYIYTS